MRGRITLAVLVVGVIGAAHAAQTLAQAPPVTSPAPAAPGSPDQVLKVRAADYFYEPSQLAVRPGPVTVEFTNDGPRRHTFNVRDAADETDLAKSPRVVAGDTVTISFTLPSEGTFTIYCSEPGHLDQGHWGALLASTSPSNVQALGLPPAASSTGRMQGRGDLSPTLIALWLHIPFITAWIGLVMFDAFALFVPGLPRQQRARMVAWSRPFAIVAIVVITATGIWQTIDNPFQEVRSYADLSNLKETTTYGSALFWKHGFVLATFGLTLLARFVLAPRLVAIEETSPQLPRLHQSLVWTTLANLAACLFALLAATRMIWELH